jgi:purine-binding chemotaxis protein CheW
MDYGVTENASASSHATAGKYLTFQLDTEIYGIEILKVQEIIGMMKVTHIPRAPGFVRGVINLRGKVIPVVDLRAKFGLSTHVDTERTCIIVVQVSSAQSSVTMGIIVDEVSEVTYINDSQIEPPPSFGASIDTAFIMGMGKLNERVVILLCVDSVLSVDELASVNQQIDS